MTPTSTPYFLESSFFITEFSQVQFISDPWKDAFKINFNSSRKIIFKAQKVML